MRPAMTTLVILCAGLLLPESRAHAQRGGRGGGARGGGMQRGGGGGGMQQGGFGGGLMSAGQGRGGGTAATGPYGASSRGAATSAGAGPRGGSYQTGSTSGSHTTQRGGTINYGAAGAGGTGPGGVTAGRGVYGVQGTTAGGRDYATAGRAGGTVGPGGSGSVGRSSIGMASGPNGAVAGGSRSGAAFGPQGAVAGGSRAGVASGPGGVAAGGSRGAAAVGPYGAAAGGSRYAAAAGPAGVVAGGSRYGAAAGPGGVVAGGSRYGAAAGPYGARYGAARVRYGTYYAGAAALATQGTALRAGYVGYGAFRPGWYGRYPGAWAAAALTLPSVWGYGNWGSVAGYCGYDQQPVYYDYGSSVVVQPDAVYVDGDPAGTPQQYADRAGQIADSGRTARPAADVRWQPLGVFAMVAEGETASEDAFQIAISPQGVLRGNYYNGRTDQDMPIYGSVDPKSRRAAWTIADQKSPVYEAGIANLTKDETTMLVHYGGDRSRQFALVRLPEPAQSNPGDAAAPPQPGPP